MIDEVSLIKQVQLGDYRVFSQLVDRHKNMVYSLVLRMVPNQQDAEEVAQDAFIKAFKAIKQFRGNSKFSTWLYRIAYFTAINHLRKKKALTSDIDFDSIQNTDETALDSMNLLDQKAYINKALTYLKPIERQLIALFYLEDFSNKEIGEITGLSQSNIKVSLLRSRKKLAGVLNALLNDEIELLIKK
ncbi:MAG: sigma-70 family RNA polymerase sigma factor [Putridiphycobacter sp.]|nr:sigma-70 family RNA polymerase sigma factor [Putridiphycobacter sp.]